MVRQAPDCLMILFMILFMPRDGKILLEQRTIEQYMLLTLIRYCFFFSEFSILSCNKNLPK